MISSGCRMALHLEQRTPKILSGEKERRSSVSSRVARGQTEREKLKSINTWQLRKERVRLEINTCARLSNCQSLGARELEVSFFPFCSPIYCIHRLTMETDHNLHVCYFSHCLPYEHLRGKTRAHDCRTHKYLTQFPPSPIELEKKRSRERQRTCSKGLSAHVNKPRRIERLTSTWTANEGESKGGHTRALSVLIPSKTEVLSLSRSTYLHRCPENTSPRMRVNFRFQWLPFQFALNTDLSCLFNILLSFESFFRCCCCRLKKIHLHPSRRNQFEARRRRILIKKLCYWSLKCFDCAVSEEEEKERQRDAHPGSDKEALLVTYSK